MIYIAHRGLIFGPDYEKENKVDFNLWLSPKKKLIGVELFIHNDLHKKVFDFLKQKEYSNSLKVINKNIEWYRMDGKKASRIMLKIEGDFLEKNDFEKAMKEVKI